MDKIEKIKGWVARDDDGTLAIHYEKPRRVCYYKNEIVSDGTPWAWENEAGYGLLPVKIFSDLKWEDEPLEVELTIKRVSTLSEEPDKSKEEAAAEFAEGEWDGVAVDTDGNPLYSQDEIEYAFIAGAEWQASQMPMPEDTVLFNKGVAEGRRLEMEDSVECEVTDVGLNYLDLALFEAERLELNKGDKVKVIVLKDNEDEE